MTVIRPLRRQLVLVAVLASAWVPQLAAAQDRGVVYSGASVGYGINVYVGGAISLPGNGLGKGLAIRVGGSGGNYKYKSAVGEVKSRYVSSEVALVWQTSGDWGWANFGVGPRVTNTRLSPIDPTNRTRGTRFDVALQTDGAYGQDVRLGWFGSYGINDRNYITQLRLSKRVSAAHNTRLGIEGNVQGDRSYDQQGMGAFVSTGLGTKWEGQLSSGVTVQKGRSAKPYVSVGLSHVF